MAAFSQAPIEAPKPFQFVGGELCLDFCNTVGGKREGVPREKIHSYSDLLSWSEQAGVVSPSQARTLLRKAGEETAESSEVLTRARALREAVYRMIRCRQQMRKPATADLAELNAVLARTLGRLRIAGAEGGFQWRWSDTDLPLDYVLGPVAASAAELLVEGSRLDLVRQCRGDNCGWLFIDASRNHSRCWCDMRDCGNRAKVRRHRQKRHSP